MEKELKKSLLKEKIQTLVQIGDAKYLDFVLKNNSLTRKDAIKKMIEEQIYQGKGPAKTVTKEDTNAGDAGDQ